MAKSIRSKWKRKMRAIKRVRYEAKNLERLKTMLAEHEVKEAQEEAKRTEEMKETPEVAEVPPAENEPTMEVEGAEKNAKFNPQTLKNANNQYPVWMSRRAIHRKSHTQKQKAKMKAKKKKGNSAWKVACNYQKS